MRRPRPAPDHCRAASRKSGLPRETLVVGDTSCDLRARRAASLPVIAVLTGGLPRRSVAGADRIHGWVGDLLDDLGWALG